MIFGKKGSGKSTLLTKLAIEHINKDWFVFSTLEIPGTYHLDYEDIGYTHFPEQSVLLIDEVGMIWDNRDFKNFKKEVRDFFKLQRHYRIKVIMFSQTFDVDKKIRDLTDCMYLVEKRLRLFSYAKRINKRTVLNESTAEAPSKLDENLVFDSLLFCFFGARRFTYIPNYIQYFDSYITPALNKRTFTLNDCSMFPKLAKKVKPLPAPAPAPEPQP